MFGRALRDFVEFDLNARAGTGSGFTGGTRQAGGAHVLDARDRAGGEEFKAGFANELFHERVADLHCPALLLGGFFSQVLRSESRPGQAVPTRGRTDVENRVAHAPGGTARDLFVAEHTKTKDVN